MKNYVQPGNTITLTAPYAVTSGDGLLVGSSSALPLARLSLAIRSKLQSKASTI